MHDSCQHDVTLRRQPRVVGDALPERGWLKREPGPWLSLDASRLDHPRYLEHLHLQLDTPATEVSDGLLAAEGRISSLTMASRRTGNTGKCDASSAIEQYLLYRQRETAYC